MAKLTDAERVALDLHEFSVKEDLRTHYCPTCGAESRSATKYPKHRDGCAYKSLMQRLLRED